MRAVVPLLLAFCACATTSSTDEDLALMRAVEHTPLRHPVDTVKILPAPEPDRPAEELAPWWTPDQSELAEDGRSHSHWRMSSHAHF
jgi:hypothetical protein